MVQKILLSLVFFSFIFKLPAQGNKKNEVNKKDLIFYELPDLLISNSGKKIKTIKEWESFRRDEIYSYFANNIYGIVPGELSIKEVEQLDFEKDALGGRAIRKQINLIFKKKDKSVIMTLLIYLPNKKVKSPVFLGYNFEGNYSVINDPLILINDREQDKLISKNEDPIKIKRGQRASRWALNKIIDSGYGLVTVNYNNVDPDKNDFSDGIHSLLYNSGQIKPAKNEWGSISAWAWGLSRIMDYLETEELIDHEKVILFGHSRLGKTALWAGATDLRFSMVISNNSGCGGAAISRRRVGEKIIDINTNFPHWFAKNFHNFNDNESSLKVDQHMLIALIAPRPVYVASASDDSWADPEGEFLAAKEASLLYNIYGKKGIEIDEFPQTNATFHGSVGYHLREGKHDVTDFDWDQYIVFANKHFR